MRRNLSRLLFLGLGILFLVAASQVFQLFQMTLSGGSNGANPHVASQCYIGKEARSQLLSMGQKVHRILENEKIQHFLCYGSLWGALKEGAIFPWSSRITFCAMNEELVKIDELFLRNRFKARGLDIEYDSADGVYRISKTAKSGSSVHINVEIILFENRSEDEQVRRIGWKRRLLPPSSDTLDAFPKMLIEKPLKSKSFSGQEYPVPREGIEIQKYHYKDNWWREVKPEGC